MRDELLLIGKALEESGGEVGNSEPYHFLVGVDVGTGPRRIGTREHAGVRERHERNGTTSDEHGHDVAVGDPRYRERRQSLRQGSDDRDTGTRRQFEHADNDGCAHHGDQYSGHALAALEQQDHRQRARTDRKRSPVGLPLQHGLRR